MRQVARSPLLAVLAFALAKSALCVENGFDGSSSADDDGLNLSLTRADTTWERTVTTLDNTRTTTRQPPGNSTTLLTTTSALPITSTTTTSLLTSTTSSYYSYSFSSFPPDDLPAPTDPSEDEDEDEDEDDRDCTSLEPEGTVTSFLVVYPSTITWTGDPADYTPPYDPITVPTYTYCELISEPPPPPTDIINLPTGDETSLVSLTIPYIIPTPTYTFITTDKNPSVIYEPGVAPGYTFTSSHGLGYDSSITKPRPSIIIGPPMFTVTAGPSDVIIGTTTITDVGPDKTTTVAVGGGTFTIVPTAVIGEGATVTRPRPNGPPPGSVFIPKPTSTHIGGVEVIVSGSHVVVDGSTLTVPPEGTTGVGNGGEAISVGPGVVVVDGQTLTVPTEDEGKETDIHVVGGDILTVNGPSVLVLHSTTITYGLGIDETTLSAGDESITVGPDGVHIHGSTLGGPDAGKDDITLEAVGGVTVTEIGGSLVIIDDHTYAIGPGATTTITTVISDETLTIGPSGVSVGDETIIPGDSDHDEAEGLTIVVATIEPTGSYLDDFPSETSTRTRDDDHSNSGDENDNGTGNEEGADEDEDEEDEAFRLIPGVLTVFATSLGVYILGSWYL